MGARGGWGLDGLDFVRGGCLTFDFPNTHVIFDGFDHKAVNLGYQSSRLSIAL